MISYQIGQAILTQGVGRTVPEQANDVLTYFGLNGAVSPALTSTAASSTGSTATAAPPVLSAPAGGTILTGHNVVVFTELNLHVTVQDNHPYRQFKV
ncbi:hypothetical protein M422DRAFT_268099 [Sphaerobolus stellatus SS14]|uniref:Uncharacterized protein n=1 Tax=Sphaerobolus stellatus (strain SS14) TaxID=990650 RepID=A0A0C9UYI5_SPHS4|nr:hypothetical protein M422DRAFT_268099 [Sphaerobolus stellatus SS14]